MAAPNSELPETTTTGKKTGVGDNAVVKTDAPPGGSTHETPTLTPPLTDWQNSPTGRTTDASLKTTGAALTFAGFPYDGTTASRAADYRQTVAGANDFVGGITGKPDAKDGAADWLFGDSDNGKTKKGEVKVSKTGPDGTPVTVDATKARVSADAGVAHIEHSVQDGTNIYNSDSYTATDTNGLRTITDKKTGYTVTWDSVHKHGELLDKDHKVAMKFDSESEFNAKIEHTLTHDRSVAQFTNKEAMDGSVQKYLGERKDGKSSAQGERIFVDAKGDYSIVAKDGILYEYDKASGKLFATKDGNRVEVQRGSTYQDVAGNTTVTADGRVQLGPTKLDTDASTLTTRSDTGTVTVTAGQGQSNVANPEVVATTLTDKGVMTNSEQTTQGVFANADTQGNVSGRTADGASYNFGATNWTVNEPNGQYTLGNDNGSICAYAPDGTPLFDTNQNGGVDVLSQPIDVNTNTDPLDADNGGTGGGDGQSGGSSGPAATSAIATFAGAALDISQVDGANLDPAKAADLAGRLRNDSGRLDEFAAAATSKGMIWAANILEARAASVRDAAERLEANERAEREPKTRVDQAEAVVTPVGATRRREAALGTLSTRTQDEDI